MFFNCELFGQKVREIRNSFEYTQEYVSKQADVHVDTIRRIENGKGTPARHILELLSIPLKEDLNKLLLDYRIYNYEEFENIKNTIEQKLEGGHYENLVDEKNKLAPLIPQNGNETYIHKLIKQFYLLIESIDLDINKKDYKSSLAKLEEAIRITTPKFTLDNYKNFVYSTIEIRILMNIALSIRKLESEEKCLEILLFCEDSIDQNEIEYRLKILYNYPIVGIDLIITKMH